MSYYIINIYYWMSCGDIVTSVIEKNNVRITHFSHDIFGERKRCCGDILRPIKNYELST